MSFGTVRTRLPHAETGQRIGLLGGSFNPPHAAHRLISEIALKRLGLDRVWWLVTPGNPLKDRSELLSLEERKALARKIASDPRIYITDFERGLGSTFTAATLAHLRLRYPRVRFVWLMGADALAGFHRWRQWRTIAATMPIAVVDRPGWHLKALTSPAARTLIRYRRSQDAARRLPGAEPPAWVMLTGPTSDLSSTAIRSGLRAADERIRRPRETALQRPT